MALSSDVIPTILENPMDALQMANLIYISDSLMKKDKNRHWTAG